jgi:hypothetical protein
MFIWFSLSKIYFDYLKYKQTCEKGFRSHNDELMACWIYVFELGFDYDNDNQHKENII